MSGFADRSAGFFGDGESPEDRLSQEAEDLMRQGRFQDAATRYQELQRSSPADVWAHLGYVSALECAGDINEAANLLEETAQLHRSNRHVQRFCRMFFERREDPVRAGDARKELAAPQFMLSDEPMDQLADLYFNQGRYHEAHAELRRLLNEEQIPEDEPALLVSINARIGACLRQEHRVGEARSYLLKALDLDPDNYWTLAELAECERAAKEPDKARAYYHRALEENPAELGCRGHLAQLEQEQGNSGEAIRIYEGILEQAPTATWAMVELAQVIAEQDPERSQALCNEALQEDPSFPWAYAQLGQLARRSGNLDEAHGHYIDALAASPGAIWILHELADTCRHMGRIDEAIAHLQHAQNSEPFDPTTHGYLGDCMRHSGRMKEACAHFAKAVELDPDYTWSWRELAETSAMLGDHERAEAAYAEARQLEPDDAINDGLKAFLLRAKGEHAKAIPYLRKAVDAVSNYAWAQRELVESLMATNQLTEAEATAKAALDKLPGFGPIRLLLADSQRRLGRGAEALREIESALQSEPDVPQLWAMRAELTSESDPRSALAFAKRAASADPAPEFRLLLAQILRMNGETEQARQLSRVVSRHHPQLANAWLLLAELAEERGDKRAAKAASKMGHRHCPKDWRITICLARLEWLDNKQPGLDRLQLAFSSDPALIPWRDVALLFAQAKRSMDCHRALSALLKQCSPAQQAEAWRCWCECEVHLGNHPAAIEAIEQAIACDPDGSANRLLAAALLEQLDDGKRAIAHLEHLHQMVPATQPLDEEQRFVLRQLAISYGRCERHDDATRSWELVLKQPELETSTRLEAIRFFRNHDQLERAINHCKTALDEADDDSLTSDAGNELLTEYGLALFQDRGQQPAIDALLVHDRHLRATSQELLAQLLFAKGEHQESLQQVRKLHGQSAKPLRRIQIMELRCLMGLSQTQDAQQLAQSLIAEEPSDEQAATLYAELLCHEGQAADALKALENAALPQRCNLERCLLTALCLLEVKGVYPALLFLGEQAECLRQASNLPPLLTVLHSAWSSVPTPAGLPAVCAVDDLRSFPLLLTAGSHCAKALAEQGRPGLAGALCAALAEMHGKRFADKASCASWQQAAFHWCRSKGMRRKAWTAAWRARSLIALARCCLP